jgi:hypothetical protein
MRYHDPNVLALAFVWLHPEPDNKMMTSSRLIS